jgi:hypothetical protein
LKYLLDDGAYDMTQIKPVKESLDITDFNCMFDGEDYSISSHGAINDRQGGILKHHLIALAAVQARNSEVQMLTGLYGMLNSFDLMAKRSVYGRNT